MSRKQLLDRLRRHPQSRRRTRPAPPAELRVETLQPRLMLAAAWTVEVTDGTLFVRDNAESEDSEILVRVRSDVVQIIDWSATFQTSVGTFANQHRLEVPLADITANRIVVFGDSGSDDLQVETKPNRHLAISFAGGDGEDTWTVNGSAFDDQFSVFDEPEPGRPLTDYTQSSADAQMQNVTDLLISEENRLVILGGYWQDDTVEVFDFDANHMGTIVVGTNQGGFYVHCDSLFVTMPVEQIVRQFSLKTFQVVRDYSTGPDYSASDAIVIGDSVYVSLYNTSDSFYTRMGRFDLLTGEFSLFQTLTGRYMNRGARLVVPSGNESLLVAHSSTSITVFDVVNGDVNFEAEANYGITDLALSTDGQHLWGVSSYYSGGGFRELTPDLARIVGGFPRDVRGGAIAVNEFGKPWMVLISKTTNTLDVHDLGAEHPRFSISLPGHRGDNIAINSTGEYAFAADSAGHLTVTRLPKRVPNLEGQTTLGIGKGVESFQLLTGAGNDVVDLSGLVMAETSIHVDGGDGDDLLTGSVRAETLSGGAGHDTISGGGGDDELFSTRANDNMRGSTVVGTLIEDDSMIDGPAILPTQIYRSADMPLTTNAIVSVSQESVLDLWIDFNGDGDVEDIDERVAVEAELLPGQDIVTFDMPTSALAGTALVQVAITPVPVSGEVSDPSLTVSTQFSVLIVDADEPRRRVLQVPLYYGTHSIVTTDGQIKLQTNSPLKKLGYGARQTV